MRANTVSRSGCVHMWPSCEPPAQSKSRSKRWPAVVFSPGKSCAATFWSRKWLLFSILSRRRHTTALAETDSEDEPPGGRQHAKPTPTILLGDPAWNFCAPLRHRKVSESCSAEPALSLLSPQTTDGYALILLVRFCSESPSGCGQNWYLPTKRCSYLPPKTKAVEAHDCTEHDTSLSVDAYFKSEIHTLTDPVTLNAIAFSARLSPLKEPIQNHLEG